jgi:hypothetical protein
MKKAAARVLDVVIIAFVAIILMVIFTPSAKAETLSEVSELSEKPKYKNDNVRKYHKANKKRFQCTACPKRKFLGIFNRK